jgi:hypothetical protein
MDRSSAVGLCAKEIKTFIRSHPEWDTADIEYIIRSWGLNQTTALCLYCEKGRVSIDHLPCECPSCGEKLRGLFGYLSPEEQAKALIRRNLLRYPPEFSLAT